MGSSSTGGAAAWSLAELKPKLIPEFRSQPEFASGSWPCLSRSA